MHLFYYQQGFLPAEDELPSAHGNSNRWPISHDLTFSQESPRIERQWQAQSALSSSSSELIAAHAAEATVLHLQELHEELQRKSEVGALQAENALLESQVVQLQEDFISLQTEFKEMKERFGERLAALDRALEAQQAVTSDAEKRVICTEDLVRFYEEQRRHTAGHWKAQCQQKDERIRYLNLQLTEYTIDWQHLGTQRQTDASLSHELQCLKDRHIELRSDCERRIARKGDLQERLAEIRCEEAALLEEEAAARMAAFAKVQSEGCLTTAIEARLQLAADSTECIERLRLLKLWRRQQEERREAPLAPPWPHNCIWRDELDVREGQLEKISAQLDLTNNALHSAQAALARQRARHEDMKVRHRDAENELREAERTRAKWQRHCAGARRVDAELRQFLEEATASGISTGEAGVAVSSNRIGFRSSGSGLRASPSIASGSGTRTALSPNFSQGAGQRMASIQKEARRPLISSFASSGPC